MFELQLSTLTMGSESENCLPRISAGKFSILIPEPKAIQTMKRPTGMQHISHPYMEHTLFTGL